MNKEVLAEVFASSDVPYHVSLWALSRLHREGKPDSAREYFSAYVPKKLHRCMVTAILKEEPSIIVEIKGLINSELLYELLITFKADLQRRLDPLLFSVIYEMTSPSSLEHRKAKFAADLSSHQFATVLEGVTEWKACGSFMDQHLVNAIRCHQLLSSTWAIRNREKQWKHTFDICRLLLQAVNLDSVPRQLVFQIQALQTRMLWYEVYTTTMNQARACYPDKSKGKKAKKELCTTMEELSILTAVYLAKLKDLSERPDAFKHLKSFHYLQSLFWQTHKAQTGATRDLGILLEATTQARGNGTYKALIQQVEFMFPT